MLQYSVLEVQLKHSSAVSRQTTSLLGQQTCQHMVKEDTRQYYKEIQKIDTSEMALVDNRCIRHVIGKTFK
jgi:hypothetical protein